MIEIAWQFDPDAQTGITEPATAEEALFQLLQGNRMFADLGRAKGDERYVIPVTAEELGFGDTPGQAPIQTPFCAMLGCADARVPLELVFSQSANGMFAVRVAGNVLDSACIGSIDYAVNHLSTVRLVAVIGHTGCGAVRAAVDAYLVPSEYVELATNLQLRGIIDTLMAAVRGADNALRNRYGHDRADHPGYYEALVATAVVFNAALSAHAVRRMFADQTGPQLGVVFGIYDLASRMVGAPDPTSPWRPGLFEPPGEGGAEQFIADIVDSQYIQDLFGGY